ncbi:RES family NAD+ phosphorylase [Dickeya fangzhongdai]|nr:RES family NAD+ phosphorylase [Dickeya fangzhongdai]
MMATFYRLVKQTYVSQAFDGAGAKLYGGRWNSKGVPCVYLGGTIALCLLETLVHLREVTMLPAFSLLSVEVPDTLVMELSRDALPADWQQDPPPDATRQIGDEWLASRVSLVLKVPSTLTGEWNALFNPEHPEAQQVLSTLQVVPFYFDSRLL